MKNLDYGKLLSDYGNVLVLLVLCAVVSFVTMEEQSPRSEAAAERLAETIAGSNPPDATVAILVRSGEGAEKFSGNLETALTNAGLTVTTNVIGNPTAARAVLESQAAPLAAIGVGVRWGGGDGGVDGGETVGRGCCVCARSVRFFGERL